VPHHQQKEFVVGTQPGKWIQIVAIAAVAFIPHIAFGGPVYFLVAERAEVRERYDSFVLPLMDEAHIAHARDLIARGPDEAGEPIIFAKIAPGADGINRNLWHPSQPQWSWHVTDVHGFGDMGIELIDGWPTFIEDDVQGWMDNTGGEIGFWSYTVVAELPGYPDVLPPPAAIPLPAALPAAGVTACLVLAVRTVRRRRRS
jgi:hypothetical protein